jgi:hypothetical protein
LKTLELLKRLRIIILDSVRCFISSTLFKEQIKKCCIYRVKGIVLLVLCIPVCHYVYATEMIAPSGVVLKLKSQFLGVLSSWDMNLNNNLFVVDSKNKVINIYDKTGLLVTSFSVPGILNYSYCDISVDESGNVFIYPQDGWGTFYVYDIHGEKRGHFIYNGKPTDLITAVLNNAI